MNATEKTEEEAFALAKACGLTEEEWAHGVKTLGRIPTETEIQMLGVLWSEHCSYKSSKPFLKRLHTEGAWVLQGPGENAGLVELDSHRALAFKIESHNHPSFVEPFQGAATGVGGILRDIFTMGARPLALGNYLRFGNFKEAKQKFLLEGVIGGIAHYGNCMGVPTVAGQVATSSCFNSNILVNVFCLGIVDKNHIFKSATAHSGHEVMIWGARTGRDGIHGASLLASQNFQSDAENPEQKIRVQVGDPFKEKCLMEATLEIMYDFKKELLAIQDMGAAGLTCSTMEVSAKSGVGMRIQLERVPLRETGMAPWEILLSESQERMLAVVQKGSEEKMKAVLQKWGCEAAVIGETTSDGYVRFEFQGNCVVNLPARLVIDPPPPVLPEPQWSLQVVDSMSFIEDVTHEWQVLKMLLADPSIASKEAIYCQYDTTVGTATVLGPGHEASVLCVGSSENPFQGVAFKGVASEHYAKIDPRFGVEVAMARSVMGLACVGARAIAYTDGMNFGNPSNPKVLGALARSIEGLNTASQLFETPCVSGNVSLYNQVTSEDNSICDIYPTVFVVMVGMMEDVRRALPSQFQKVGNEIWCLEVPGNSQTLPYGSLYADRFWPEDHPGKNILPFCELKGEKRLQEALLQGNEKNIFLSCRDVSRGGLAIHLAKACFSKKLKGFEGNWSNTKLRRDFQLFGEGQGRVIVEIEPSKRSELMKLALDWDLHAKRLGTVLEEPVFRIQPLMSGSMEEIFQAWTSIYK